MRNILDFFPYKTAREPQRRALEFIETKVAEGFRDIVIAAPTGVGKSGIGTACCFWGTTLDFPNYENGGYYLVTQKLLQDQLEADICKFDKTLASKAASIKTAAEYPCVKHKNCQGGYLASQNDEDGCRERRNKTCPHYLAKERFLTSELSITNYAYFFTELTHSGKIRPKKVLVADECHTLEQQIISYAEIEINEKIIQTWVPKIGSLPKLNTLQDFSKWLAEQYVPACEDCLKTLEHNLFEVGYSNPALINDHTILNNHIGRLHMAVASFCENPKDWVYWQEPDTLTCHAKPLSAALMAKDYIQKVGAVRIYLSAFPGEQSVFCRSLGLAEESVAWLSLDHPFPVEHRRVHFLPVGSMSQKTQENVLPSIAKMCETIMESHPHEKGIIHCFDEKTRICTNRGFVPVLELRKTDYLLTVSPVSLRVQWQKPEALVRQDYEGKVFRLRTKELSFKVTPEHLLWVNLPTNKGLARLLTAEAARKEPLRKYGVPVNTRGIHLGTEKLPNFKNPEAVHEIRRQIYDYKAPNYRLKVLLENLSSDLMFKTSACLWRDIMLACAGQSLESLPEYREVSLKYKVKNEQDRDNLLTLAALCGWGSSYKEDKKEFFVEVFPRRLESNFYGKELTVERYSGKVGCPSTNNGVVLIERNGLVSWSGNCHAYKIGTYLADKLSSTGRVLFCPDAKSRNTVLREHKNNSKPTVIISPSITEGYSFDYDLARFQIIVKMPFPYIGDRRVAIKMETDKDWYMLRTIMTIVQAAGRIVRDYEDSGVTYILDSDFYRIYKQYSKFFPAWFLEALQFHGQTSA